MVEMILSVHHLMQALQNAESVQAAVVAVAVGSFIIAMNLGSGK